MKQLRNYLVSFLIGGLTVQSALASSWSAVPRDMVRAIGNNPRTVAKVALLSAGSYGVYRMYQADRLYLKTGITKLKTTSQKYQVPQVLGSGVAAVASFFVADAAMDSYGIRKSVRTSAALTVAGAVYNALRTQDDFDGLIKFVKPDITFADVKGGVPAEIYQVYDQIAHPELAKEYGVETINGILMFGVPGTGKTYVAKALAGQLGEVPFLSIKSTELMNKYYGETESRIKRLFEKARKEAAWHPHKIAIIFIDEIDAVGGNRAAGGGKDNGFKAVQALLAEMDGILKNESGERVIVLAATNDKDTLDPALKRRGRFDYHIEMVLPSKPKRKELFCYYGKNLKKLVATEPEKEALFEALAEHAQGKSPADIEAFVKHLNRQAFLTRTTMTCAQVKQAAVDYLGISFEINKGNLEGSAADYTHLY